MRTKAPRKTGHHALTKMVSVIDDLAAFEEHRNSLIPSLQRDLKNGLSADQILKKYEAVAAARLISSMARPDTEGEGLRAATQVLDRRLGKPKETKDITHRLANLPEEEVDALLLTKLKELEGDIEVEDET